jgi:prepilin-type N-terminal cleavage/methylation domain-containing protein
MGVFPSLNAWMQPSKSAFGDWTVRANRTTRHPSGFTLIELLVVMSIMAALAAIGVSVYFRVREAAELEADERVVLKYNMAFNSQASAELDDANAAFTGKKGGFTTQVDTIRAICGNDSDRAQAVWRHIWMQNAFPQTFNEAVNPIVITVNMPSVGILTMTMPARSTFLQMPTLTVGSLTPAEQSAILLHRILTQKGTRGQTLGDDAIGTNLTTIPNTTFQMLNDARGRPIIFVRSAHNDELDDVKAGFVKPGGSSINPYDPRGRTLAAKWTALDATMMVPIRTRVANALGMADFTNQNFMPSLVGVGTSKPDRNTVPTNFYPNLTLTAPTATPYGAGITTLSEDEGYILGYKLRRPGRRGDS